MMPSRRWKNHSADPEMQGKRQCRPNLGRRSANFRRPSAGFGRHLRAVLKFFEFRGLLRQLPLLTRGFKVVSERLPSFTVKQRYKK